MISNQRGSVVVATIFIVPLFLVLISICSWLFFILNTKEKIEHSCRQSVLQSEKTLVNYGEFVIKLNPIAEYLKSLRIIASGMMAHPVTLVPGRALLLLTRKLQNLLKRAQLLILKIGRAHSLFYLHRHKFELFKLWQNSKLKVFWRVYTMWSRPKGSKIRLVKTNRELAPTYDWAEKLEKKQEISIRWKIRFKESSFFKYWLGDLGLSRWAGSCYARPEKRSESWIPILGRAR